MFDTAAFLDGATAFLLFFLVAGLFTIAFKLIYSAVTPYRERELIKSGNTAAAVALGGALIGYVLPLGSALTHTVSLAEFAAWATLAGVVQILVFTGVRILVLPDVKARIENNETATAAYLAAVSVVVGVLNAACMTY
jgi:putative membrane protein